MDAFKRFGFIPFILLTACSPPKTFNMPESSPPNLKTGNLQTKENNQETVVATPSQPLSQKSTTSSVASGKIPSSWELSGAMAARSNSKSWTASVNWLQRGAGSYQIRLFGPLGSGSILIEKKGGMVSFRDGPKSAQSRNADELLSQQTGIRLPVNNLYYWVRGIPAPGPVQTAQRSANNQLTLLRQAGYTIQYLGYGKGGQSNLPSLIKLQGNGVAIKFVIKSWKV